MDETVGLNEIDKCEKKLYYASRNSFTSLLQQRTNGLPFLAKGEVEPEKGRGDKKLAITRNTLCGLNCTSRTRRISSTRPLRQQNKWRCRCSRVPLSEEWLRHLPQALQCWMLSPLRCVCFDFVDGPEEPGYIQCLAPFLSVKSKPCGKV